MAKRNILMKKKNGTVWDELYPITTANNVKVSSISGLTGTDVQSCLQNLFTFADNGKKNIATVIGSPLTSTDTFDSMKSKIQTLKNTFASNLTSKGQSSSGSDTLNNLINKIANISTGKKSAFGVNYPISYKEFSISGLDFKPSIVVGVCNANNLFLNLSSGSELSKSREWILLYEYDYKTNISGSWSSNSFFYGGMKINLGTGHDAGFRTENWHWVAIE